ncbi:MAG: cyclic nucleotide-binding domain-containing protein [Anaerolineales bacterium]|nr:cyclic nucleotide-binding domain-containing protein [Anaerolineales bacterium]
MISPDILRQYPHFAEVPDECLKSLAMISEERTFKAGERIFEESVELKEDAQNYEIGEEATDLLILIQGQIDIIFSLASGEEVVVDTRNPGDLLAISALIYPFHLTASGIAREDGKLIQLKAPELRQLCEEVPELGYLLMRQVAKTAMNRLNHTRSQLAAQR